ncbi:MAG: type II toxin-antitoxin system RelE/ParE family toxin [Methanolinea sp.]
MTWTVLWSPHAIRSAKKVPRPVLLMIRNDLLALVKEPDPRPFLKKIKGQECGTVYSHRVGMYRIILDIGHDCLIILVIEVGHRKHVYRDM